MYLQSVKIPLSIVILIVVSSFTAAAADQADLLQIAQAAKLKIKTLDSVESLPGFFTAGQYLLFEFSEKQVKLKRQYHVVEDIFGLTPNGERVPVSLRQGPHQWMVTRVGEQAKVGVFKLGRPFVSRISAPIIPIKPNTSARFPARFADINKASEKLQFESLAYKNTVGYWVNKDESPVWNFRVTAPARFQLRILQGCGQGQGGSEISIEVGNQKLYYQVKETGQFQAFRWFDVGTVEFDAAQTGQIKVKVKRLAKNAVMDIRQIKLEPITQSRQSDKTSKPNILLFYTDDQGTLDANCYGSQDLHTPNIDGLAQTGIRFTQAYAHTVCCPSRAMLMTGRVPQRSNVNSWTQGNAKGPAGRNMNLSEQTIAEILKANGYQTALFGKWHLGAALSHGPTQQGFDQFFGLRGGFIDNFNHFYLHGAGFHDLYDKTKEVFRPGEYFPDLVTEKSIQFLKEHRQSPFLLCVPFNIPHYPEQADPVFDQRYVRLKQPRQSYAKMISTTDERMGRILRQLDELRLRDQTIVVFMSDNGHSAENYAIRPNDHTSGLPKDHNYGANGGGGNTGKWRGNKGTFFEGGIRVPAIISYPKQLPQGVVRDQAITACDWLPTILDLCGIPQPDQKLDGQSLLPIIIKNAKSHHRVMHWQWQKKWAVRKGDWKLIGTPKQLSLYSLAGDKPESTDLAPQNPAVVAELKSLHEKWIAEVN